MVANIPLSPVYLRERLIYHPEIGKLSWLDHESMPNNWRGRFVGKEAFTAVTNTGYKHGYVQCQKFLAHRVAFALYYGEWPSDQIDHVNGIRTDNRIANLRVVTNQENGRNTSMRNDNTSGTTGVIWDKRANKWRAQIGVSGKCVYLGAFQSLDDAKVARERASSFYGFTERHGKL